MIMALILPTATAFSVGNGGRVFVGTPVNQNRRLVSDCMTPAANLCTLTESSTVDQAVSMLLDFDVSGAPVINQDTGALLGIVSTFDFLQQEAGDGALLPFEGDTFKYYLKKAKKICATKVGDLMTSNPITMREDESMRNAAILMSQENLHRLPIVDEKGRMVGMLTSSDVMKDMVHTVWSLPPGHDDGDDIETEVLP